MTLLTLLTLLTLQVQESEWQQLTYPDTTGARLDLQGARNLVRQLSRMYRCTGCNGVMFTVHICTVLWSVTIQAVLDNCALLHSHLNYAMIVVSQLFDSVY